MSSRGGRPVPLETGIVVAVDSMVMFFRGLAFWRFEVEAARRKGWRRTEGETSQVDGLGAWQRVAATASQPRPVCACLAACAPLSSNLPFDIIMNSSHFDVLHSSHTESHREQPHFPLGLVVTPNL